MSTIVQSAYAAFALASGCHCLDIDIEIRFDGPVQRSCAKVKRAAARQFDAVLACDPGNARAREGRERVRQAQSAEEGPSQ